MLHVQGIMETVVYVDDMDQAHRFYSQIIGLERIFEGDALFAYDAGQRSVLLVFKRDSRTADLDTPGGVVPGHNSTGHAHFAFRIQAESYEEWKKHMAENGIEIISEVSWPSGGLSFYFNDPDGNVLEMATPGIWLNDPI